MSNREKKSFLINVTYAKVIMLKAVNVIWKLWLKLEGKSKKFINVHKTICDKIFYITGYLRFIKLITKLVARFLKKSRALVSLFTALIWVLSSRTSAKLSNFIVSVQIWLHSFSVISYCNLLSYFYRKIKVKSITQCFSNCLKFNLNLCHRKFLHFQNVNVNINLFTAFSNCTPKTCFHQYLDLCRNVATAFDS